MFSKWRERNLRAEKEKLERIVVERTVVVEKQNEELVQKRILIEKQKAVVEKEKQRSDDLLLNILPGEVAEELKAKGSAEAKQFDEVTVLFTDFKDFTRISEKMAPKELVEELHTCFMNIDNIIEKFGIEKIKTIGDSYMCAGGLPVANTTHAADVVGAGLEIQKYIIKRIAERTASGYEPFHIRIGIHTGPVVAGIVGIRKFAYDIWGDSVNTASRMETNGEEEKVNISGSTYELVKDLFTCIHRGKIKVKGKGELDMYFVEGWK
jgi:class 3 adenylate cyclase